MRMRRAGHSPLLLQALAVGACPGLGDRCCQWGTGLTDATHPLGTGTHVTMQSRHRAR